MSRYDIRIANEPILEGEVAYFAQPGAPELHGFESIANQLRPALRDIEPGGFLLARDQFEVLEEDGTHAELFECEEFYYGRHKNSHGLLFGQLALSSEVDRGRQVFAALKPFDTMREAFHEYAATLYVNNFRADETRPLAFQPLGFHRMHSGEIALLTEYDPTVTSFDNIFWDVDKPPTPNEVAKALAYCVVGLARLHAYGLNVNDAQVKNHAADNIGPRFVDLEAVTPFPTEEGVFDIERIRFGITQDIGQFVNSLTTGIEDPEDAPDYRPQLHIAFERYPGYVRHPSSYVPHGAVLTSEEIATVISHSQ